MHKNDFWIDRHPRGYYQVHFGGHVISTADTEREAEEDIGTYKKQITKYLDTGIIEDSRISVFFS